IFNYILNGIIILFLVFVIYLGFSFLNNSLKSDKKTDVISDTAKTLTNQPNLSIQLEVQNGTGEKGIAAVFTEYLRKNGVDVVESGNFNTEDEERTLLIDRIGDNAKAKRVASILGLNNRNIIQQINNSLYLDITVVIGKDFKELKPFTDQRK
ncbi:MAG TPA: LytR C-terminal domain-containing protein, partial [Ignavibacteria bacterium]|nr:LytR C-terminal domain-containing protein [Ignavibacteria bacterium]